MAKLAIKGHKEKSKEVIALLEMFGGNNKYYINITECNLLYTIREGDDAIIATYPNSNISQIFTLEQFLEKFPYKVGDKVSVLRGSNYIFTIKSMTWDTDLEKVSYRIEAIDGIENEFDWYADELIYYSEQKEKTMEEIKIDIPKGYEFAGIDDNRQQVVFTKIQPEYPNTYKECFNICFGNKHHIVQVVGLDGLGDNKELFESFIKLKICRDAYWKIAGDWKPNWKDFSTQKYSISVDKDEIILSQRVTGSRILVFPTKELRDAFYENFKDLINDCKELL